MLDVIEGMGGLMTPKEVADLLRVSMDTVYRRIHCGELDGFRVGRQLRIRGDSVTKFLSQPSLSAPKRQPVVTSGVLAAYARKRLG